LAEGKNEESLDLLLSSLKIHLRIEDMLGVGADLGYMGRAVSSAERYDGAIVLFEMALSIFRAIDDRWGQALDLRFQAEAFDEIEARAAARAAYWQAREIFHAIHSPSAEELDAIFEGLKEQMDEEDYRGMIADLEAKAEEIRIEGVKAAWEAAKDDPFIQEIAGDLGIDLNSYQ